MARGRLAMRKVKKILAFHFDEGRSARAIATHCGLARRSVAQTLERFAASGLSWLEARDLDEEVLEAALYRISRASDWPEVDWAKVEKDLSGRGMTLMLLWEEWRETHPDGMSYPTWCRRFREWRPRRDVTMRQNRRPGERLFVDYAGGCVSKVVEIGFGASPSGLSFAAVRPRGQGFRRRLADRGFPIHRLCASGFGRKRGAPRGASALFRDTAARSVF